MTPAVVAGGILPGQSPVRARTETVRIMAAFAGLGAGTLSFGTSSTLLGAAPNVLVVTGTLAAAAWGVTLCIWAVQSLRRGRPAWAGKMARLVSLAVLVHLAAVAQGIWWVDGGSARFLDITALSAAASELLLLGSLGWLFRQDIRAHAGAGAPAAGRLLIGAFAAALLVAAITAPGLAATTAGNHALPHGSHVSPPKNVSNGHHH